MGVIFNYPDRLGNSKGKTHRIIRSRFQPKRFHIHWRVSSYIQLSGFRYHIDIPQRGLSCVLDIMLGFRRTVQYGSGFHFKLFVVFHQEQPAARKDDEEFFIAARGVPAHHGAWLQLNGARAHRHAFGRAGEKRNVFTISKLEMDFFGFWFHSSILSLVMDLFWVSTFSPHLVKVGDNSFSKQLPSILQKYGLEPNIYSLLVSS
jgi:hypothetical protein